MNTFFRIFIAHILIEKGKLVNVWWKKKMRNKEQSPQKYIACIFLLSLDGGCIMYNVTFRKKMTGIYLLRMQRKAIIK